jgi:hypothetical protein
MLSFISVGCGLVGCLEGEWTESDSAGDPADEALGAESYDSCPIAKPAPAPFALDAELEDVALCQAQAEREQECFEECAPTVDVDACANRYACSRQLWRQDIVAEVYDCIAAQPCDDRDPAATCLARAAAAHGPSDAQQRFENDLTIAAEDCGDLLTVTAGQGDDVYEGLAHCLADNDSCDAKSSCAMITLGMLVDEACGVTDSI